MGVKTHDGVPMTAANGSKNAKKTKTKLHQTAYAHPEVVRMDWNIRKKT